MEIFKDLAPKYWDCGISVMPVKGKGDCEMKWQRWCERIATEMEQETFIKYKPNHNISLLTGEASGILAIDIDLYKGTEDYEKINALVPYTPCAKFGQKGITYFFKGNKDLKSLKVQKIVDILWNGCHTVIPPSIHESTNKPYTWIGEDLLGSYQELPEINKETIDQIYRVAKEVETKRKNISKITGDKDHLGRNVNLFKQALAGLYKGKKEDEIVSELINYDRNNHNPPYFSDPKENKHGLSELEFCKQLVTRAKTKTSEVQTTNVSKSEVVKAELGIVLDKKGFPVNNIDNLVRVCEVDDKFKNKIWFDEFHQKIFTTLWTSEPVEWQEKHTLNLLLAFQRDLGFYKAEKEKIKDAVKIFAFKNLRNEPKEWLNSLTWDEIPRLQSFLYKGFGTELNEYYEELGKNWLMSMVARIMVPGCKVDSMPILEGPQGKFKSTALAILGGKWFAESSGSIDDKDYWLAMQGKLLIEVSELDSFNKADITEIKKFITRQTDRFRSPYGERVQDYPRQCVFCGSTNENTYLRDPTGARRFFPIKVGNVSLDYLNEFRSQLFAEAVYLYKLGENWWDMPGQLTSEMQEARREIDPLEQPIQEFLIGKVETNTNRVLEHLNIPLIAANKSISNRVAGILRISGYELSTKRENGKVHKVWKKI